MAKQSQLDKMLAGIDAEIAQLQSEIAGLQKIKARMVALVKPAPVRRPRALPKDEKASA